MLRPDSPLRSRSPRRPTFIHASPVRSTITAKRDEIYSPRNESLAVGHDMPVGAARSCVTQALLMNRTRKEFRQRDLVRETPWENSARVDSLVRTAKQELLETGGPLGDGQNARSHYLRHDEEEELVSALREYIRLEQELDGAKMRLALQPDFNLMDAFQMLDKFTKGFVTAPEIIESLTDLGTHPHKDDVHLFLRRYDGDQDGRILYSDFCDAFTPFDGVTA